MNYIIICNNENSIVHGISNIYESRSVNLETQYVHPSLGLIFTLTVGN